eukprot:scaffold5705_cov444-Prasinococcus_capsulatus_cf.AAC.2
MRRAALRCAAVCCRASCRAALRCACLLACLRPSAAPRVPRAVNDPAAVRGARFIIRAAGRAAYPSVARAPSHRAGAGPPPPTSTLGRGS